MIEKANINTESQLHASISSKKMQTPASISTSVDLQQKKQVIHDVYK